MNDRPNPLQLALICGMAGVTIVGCVLVFLWGLSL